MDTCAFRYPIQSLFPGLSQIQLARAVTREWEAEFLGLGLSAARNMMACRSKRHADDNYRWAGDGL